MPLNRRDALRFGAAAAAALGEGLPMTARAKTLSGDAYNFGGTGVVVHPVNHASLVLGLGSLTIYNDPVGSVSAYDGLPPPDLILVTHQHSDHYNAATLAGLVADDTRLIVNPGVAALLPADLRRRATTLANGEATTIGELEVVALPAYNLSEGRRNYHPQHRDNGYLLALGAVRLYIAGDTEDIPEMRALADVDIAFLPMNQPYTMTIGQAADAVAAFRPRYVYPYHCKGSDLAAFARLVAAGPSGTKAVLRDWYA